MQIKFMIKNYIYRYYTNCMSFPDWWEPNSIILLICTRLLFSDQMIISYDCKNGTFDREFSHSGHSIFKPPYKRLACLMAQPYIWKTSLQRTQLTVRAPCNLSTKDSTYSPRAPWNTSLQRTQLTVRAPCNLSTKDSTYSPRAPWNTSLQKGVSIEFMLSPSVLYAEVPLYVQYVTCIYTCSIHSSKIFITIVRASFGGEVGGGGGGGWQGVSSPLPPPPLPRYSCRCYIEESYLAHTLKKLHEILMQRRAHACLTCSTWIPFNIRGKGNLCIEIAWLKFPSWPHAVILCKTIHMQFLFRMAWTSLIS